VGGVEMLELLLICRFGMGGLVPIVPRPPTLKRPKREKGAEQVMMLGVTLRMTITSDGLDGMSFDDMLVIVW